MLVTLANHLDRRHFQPVLVVLNARGPLAREVHKDIPVINLRSKRVSLSWRVLLMCFLKYRPQAVISTLVHLNGVCLTLKPFFPRTRFIMRESGMPSVLIKESRWKGVLCRLIYRHLYALADDVLCPSRRVREELSLVAPGLNNLRLFCNPVDVSRLDTKTVEEARAFYARTDQSLIRFLCVGRLDHEKGFDRVIESLGQVTLPYRWRLDIIGKGRERKHLERLIDKHGLKGKVFLRGYQASPWPMMKQADLLLLPSRSEGMPNVALEALACGLPVLAVADAGGITEIDQLPDPAAIEIATDMAGMTARLSGRKFPARRHDRPALLPPQFNLQHVTESLAAVIDRDRSSP